MGANDAAEMLESAKAEDIHLEQLVKQLEVDLAAATTPRLLTDTAGIASMPRGTVLLCREHEVFWLAPTEEPGSDAPRLWYAVGYDPALFDWTDAQVAEWGPLTVLHQGAKP